MTRVKKKTQPILHTVRLTTGELSYLYDLLLIDAYKDGWERFNNHLLLKKLERNIPKHLKDAA